MALFELKGGRCGYGNHVVLDGVDLSVDSGEVVCILGSNGVGKSTLFKSMLGLIPLIKGSLTIHDESILNWSRKKIARYIGYVPQAMVPHFNYSVFDAVVMGRTAHLGSFSSPSERDEEISMDAICRLGIEGLIHKNLSEISGGEKQLVVLARALAQQPEILIMDEPTAALDFGNQQLVLEHIYNLSRDGLSIIMASHFPDHAFLYAHRSVLLKDGKIYSSGKSEEVITEKSLYDLYHVDAKIIESDLISPLTKIKIKTCIPVGAIYLGDES